ncbi:integrase family protein [Chitinophaga pinensis DSM 2588]|uniref:Integrase family protein n=2 Tax=Chitinophaga pinensis TaxID=79329 RepID=A0A979G5N0_CHIPD|nr:integrase family protein [Chitinophaga pinensis DSM 2588]
MLIKNKIESVVAKYVAQCKILEKPILRSELSEHLDYALNKKVRSTYDLWADWDQFVSDIRSGVILKKDGTRYREASAKHYENSKTILKRYEVTTGKVISYSLNMNGVKHFIGWMVTLGQSKNSIACVIKDLKAFFVRTHGIKHNNKIALDKDFSYSGEESDTIALSDSEILSLYSLELTGSLEKARDVFVFGCWVALRVGDLSRINDYHRRGNLIEVLTTKTSEKVIIPLHWMARKILDKYGDGNLPVYTTAEGLSYHLNDLCKMAGINSKHLITITKGGNRIAEYYEKWQLVSPHTARRSFATNMYKAGFPVKSIMKITGHRTEAAFFRYIRIDKEQNAEELAASPYFNGPAA